jgi:hypothetical protein
MKNLYRRYKISKLLDEPLLDKEKEIVEFVLDKIKDLTIFIDEYGGCYNYMNSNDEFIFEYDKISNVLLIRYDDFWSVLNSKYLIEHNDIGEILLDIITKVFNISANRIFQTRNKIKEKENNYFLFKNKIIN